MQDRAMPICILSQEAPALAVRPPPSSRGGVPPQALTSAGREADYPETTVTPGLEAAGKQTALGTACHPRMWLIPCSVTQRTSYMNLSGDSQEKRP